MLVSGLHGFPPSSLKSAVLPLRQPPLRNSFQFITMVWVLLAISEQRAAFVVWKESVATQLMPWVVMEPRPLSPAQQPGPWVADSTC